MKSTNSQKQEPTRANRSTQPFFGAKSDTAFFAPGQSVQRDPFFQPSNASLTTPIQAKLTVGAVGDKYEQEADRVAAEVVDRINSPAVQQGSDAQTVQRMGQEEDEVQMKRSSESIQRVEQEEEKLQTKPIAETIQRTGKEDEELQMKSAIAPQVTTQGGDVSSGLDSAIQQERGGGQAIAEPVRASLEQAFGADFSGVRVHTDAKSDQLNRTIQAEAFTSRKDVFFRQGAYQPGSRVGQELLAHELTHVVQQRSNTNTVQRAFLDIESNSFSEYVKEQKNKQSKVKAEEVEGLEPFTTVGFEHEFTQTNDENRLIGISHLKFAKSSSLPYTDLPFILETDAANAIELVSPPFLIRTLQDTRIPNPTDVEKVDALTRSALEGLTSKSETIGELVDGFIGLGIDFKQKEKIVIGAKNLSHKSAMKDYSKEAIHQITKEELSSIKIKPSQKGGGITSQVNFATNADTIDKLQKINEDKQLKTEGKPPGFNPKAILVTIEEKILNAIVDNDKTTTKSLFYKNFARTLSGIFATPAIDAVRKMQEEIYTGKDITKDSKAKAEFQLRANLTSAVKDVHGAWIKDSLMNVGLGLLDDTEWNAVKEALNNRKLEEVITNLSLPTFININGFEKEPQEGNKIVGENLKEAKNRMLEAIKIVVGQIDRILDDSRPSKDLAIVPINSIKFMEHNKEMIGPRQDTYIDPRKAQITQVPERLHVVEARRDGISSLYKLGLASGKLDRAAKHKIKEDTEKKIEELLNQISKAKQAIDKVDEDEKELRNEKVSLEGKIKQLDENMREPTALKQDEGEDIKKYEKRITEKKKELKSELAKREKRLKAVLGLIERAETENPKRKQNLDEKITTLQDAISEHKQVLEACGKE
ncbi:DUF4157 domain-containing protein [Trichocoleus sp. FACHB-591]|uniref:eCIS core domain-containing protein n=1 Tax=Trichocoleus sp. FACHB-591 TaxID=2692872 RepID=UPI001683EF72|nr:DUF4157 domain-containing protein [Trichocoleus sp. FACHB-591]MBD2095616.1 DUF4157 domain-containing protein [Trichocoleus sp. FACHB-591]